jgi:hypothetical protein
MVTRERPGGTFTWSYWPWHVLLLGAYPALFLFSSNLVDEVTLEPLWGPLLACLGLAGGLLVGFFALRRDWARAGLMASTVLLVFFTFGHAWNLISPVLDQRWLLAAIWVVWGLALVQLAWRGGPWVRPATRVLNLVLFVLVGINVVTIGGYMAATHAFAAMTGEIPDVRVGAAGRPDVYYIVLDRYAGETTLDRFFNYDNGPFLEALEERGFSVAHDSWANYFKTSLSVFATMTMSHLNPDLYDDSEPDSFGQIHAAFQARMAVPATFKSLGYEYVHIANWWEPTSKNADADVIYRFTQESEFSTTLFATTLLSALSPEVSADEDGAGGGEEIKGLDLQRAHVLLGFDSLEQATHRSGPTFTFAHLTVPHPPYAFNEDGTKPTPEQQAERTDNEGYIEQLKYANRRTLEAIDQIIANTPPGDPEPIIILQSDEGPFPPRFREQGADFQWLEATDDEILWKFNVLTAYRLPGVDAESEGFSDRISPVNAFRIVFNAYFDAGLDLLPDVTYLSPDHDHMWSLVEYPR